MWRLSLLLLLQNIAWLLGPVRLQDVRQITFMANFMGFNVRPYILFAGASCLIFLFTIRLRLRGIYLDTIDRMLLEKVNLRLLEQIERKIKYLKQFNHVIMLAFSMITVAFSLSFAGWEYAITGLAGVKSFCGFSMFAGFILWLATKRLFELRDDL